MKINLKTISLIAILGSLFYFLSHKNKTIKSTAPVVIKEIVLDKKTNSAKLTAPKVYISAPSTQNGLELGNNWKSR
jgi:hypothetical protein